MTRVGDLSRAAALAADLRHRRSELVRRVAEGDLTLSTLLGDEVAAPIKVVVLAEAVPGAGKVGSRRVLESLGVAPGARWGELSAGLAAQVASSLEPDLTDGGASRATAK